MKLQIQTHKDCFGAILLIDRMYLIYSYMFVLIVDSSNKAYRYLKDYKLYVFWLVLSNLYLTSNPLLTVIDSNTDTNS